VRIGLNLLFMIPGVVGGTETYAKGLLTGLKEVRCGHEFTVFLNRESAGLASEWGPDVQAIVCPVQAARRADRYVFEQVRLPRLVHEHGIDLLHSLGYVAPRFVRCASVVSVPDLNYRAFGGTMSFVRRAMLEVFVRQSLLHADRIVTISEFSRREIQREYGIPAEKITVTYLAASLENATIESDRPENRPAGVPDAERPYMIAFSSTYANKNIPRLIEAFKAAWSNKKITQRLVLVGHRFTPPDGAGQIEEGTADDGIVWTGYLDRRVLFRMLRGADFLVFPSFYEGFGLPVLESMGVGVPVLCSSAASLPEVAGEAAVLFDPYSVADLTEKLIAMGNDAALRESLRRKGFENLKRFSWERTARETVDVYEEVWRGKKN
jgi:glycosyltransferase involved in cell wall biosynthesis